MRHEPPIRVRRAALPVALSLACGKTPPPDVTPTAQGTPKSTVLGNTFIAPAGWTVAVRGPATILTPPEGNSAIALVDVRAPSADSAVAAAWAAYKPDAKWPLKVVNPKPDEDGWTNRAEYWYQTSPNEKRDVGADVQRAGDVWTVALYDMAQAVGEKRLAQVALIYGELLPKGYTRESFAGKKAHRLDEARIAELGRFVQDAMRETGVPGVGVGLIQDGKVVFAGGFGTRELGGAEKVDADTRFMIASNTKAMTTLMLAKLVDAGKLTWDTPVTDLLPSFKLGNPETTRQVKVRHLICACTGLPRQDFEWLFQFEGVTPDSALATLATMQPTSGFGEMFQYSNPLAGAAGYVGGHVAFPDARARRRLRQRHADARLRSARHARDHVRLRRGLARKSCDARVARRGRQARTRGHGAQLLDHPGAPRGRRLEQRARHARLRRHGAGRRKAA